MSPVSSGGTPARKNGLELGNAALPVLDSGQGGDAEVEEALAKLLAGAAVPRWSSPRRNGEGRWRWRGEMRTARARGGVVASK